MKPSPNVPTPNAPTAAALRQVERQLPAAEGFLLLVRQRLSAALLAHRAAGAQAEVEIVEDLCRFVGHIIQCTSLASPVPARLLHVSDLHVGTVEELDVERALGSLIERVDPELIVASGDLTHRGTASASTTARRRS